MIATLERREGVSLWERFCAWITSTENRLYIGWFGCLMFPIVIVALPELSKTCVCSNPPSILYLTLPFDSPPLTVKTPVPFTQNGPFGVILIVFPLVDVGLMVMVVFPEIVVPGAGACVRINCAVAVQLSAALARAR